MVSEDIKMLIGATITAGVDGGLVGYANFNPAAKTSALYTVIHPAIPPVNCLIADAGVPLAMYAIGKALAHKKGSKTNALIELAKGGAVYGVSDLIGQTVYRLALFSQGITPLSYVMRR